MHDRRAVKEPQISRMGGAMGFLRILTQQASLPLMVFTIFLVMLPLLALLILKYFLAAHSLPPG
jgi:hypothetical protein